MSWVVGVVCGVAALIAVADLGDLQASLADAQRQLPARPGSP